METYGQDIEASTPSRGCLRATGHVLAVPFLALFVPFRAARFVPARGVGRGIGVAGLAGVLLAPALLLALVLAARDVAPPSAETVGATALPAPQAALMEAVAAGIVEAPAPPLSLYVRAVARWLATGLGAGLGAALLLGLALQPFLGRDWLRTFVGGLRAGAYTVAAVPLAVLVMGLGAGLVVRAQHPLVEAPPWLFVATGLGFVWASLAAAFLARGALQAGGAASPRRAALGGLAAALLVWPIAWLALQLATLALAPIGGVEPVPL